MLNKDYIVPGLAAITLAVLFPIYWGYQYTLVTESNFTDAYFANITSLSLSDWVFLTLGALEIYIYFSLRRVLVDRVNFRYIDVLLFLFICTSTIYYIGNFGIDIGIFFAENITGEVEELAATISFSLSIICMLLYGVLDFLISIILLFKFKLLPIWLRIFAIATLVMSLLELTFSYEFVVILYPISLLILAVYFLQKPEVIEVV